MVPSMAPQPASTPADSASIAGGAAAAGAPQSADSGAAASDGAAAFNDALANACGDAPKSHAHGKGAARRKEAACEGASASTPTFPAWRLVIALAKERIEDPTSGKGHQKKSETGGDAAKDADTATGAVDASAAKDVAVAADLPVVPAVDQTVPLPSANAGDDKGTAATSGVEATTDPDAPRENGRGAALAATASVPPPADVSGYAGSVPTANDNEAHAARSDAAGEAAIQEAGEARQPVDTAADAAVQPHAKLPVLTDAASTDRNDASQAAAAPAATKAAAAPHAMPSKSAAPGASANGTAPQQAPVAASAQDAAASDTDAAAGQLAASASSSTTASTEKSETRQSPQEHATEATPTAGKSFEATTTSAMSHAGGGNRDASSQHGESDDHGRNASPEPLMASRAVAFTSAMTLVSSPDGTLRIASLLSAPPPRVSLLPEESTANIDSMVQTMRVMVRETVSEATLHLHPEHFGEVTIQVRVDGKSVSAIVNTESSGVREWLQGQESTLRNGLSEHGLQLDRLVVQRDGRHDRRQQGQPEQGPRRRRTRDDADAQQTFEVSV